MWDWLSGIAEGIGNLASNITAGLSEKLSGLGDRITGGLSSLKESVVSLPDTIGNLLTSLKDGILEGIRDIFVPSEDYVSDRWNAIRQRFAFADGLSVMGDYLGKFFRETAFDEPPKVYIDLRYAESKYDYGGQTYCLDMTWYARYKPTVDGWLSAFIWLCFAWRVYVRLPSIINGAGSDFEVVDNFSSRESLFNQGTKIRARRENKHSVDFRRNR